MLKFIVFELIKAYFAHAFTAPSTKIRPIDYFIGIVAGIALILLIIADYVYLYQDYGYPNNFKDLLIVSTILFTVAAVIKIVMLIMAYRAKRRNVATAALSDLTALPQIIPELLPTAICLIPVGIIGYAIWTKIQAKLFEKKSE